MAKRMTGVPTGAFNRFAGGIIWDVAAKFEGLV